GMYIIVTNNNLCYNKYRDNITVDYLENSTYLEVLTKVRDYIHKGYCLETHPMAGSLKPNQIPYKSVIISDRKAEQEELFEFTMIIENGITLCKAFMKDKPTPDWNEALCEDFRIVDLSLIESVADRLKA
ncbi:MAG: GrdX family protein, partial [Clostridium sp.]